MCAVNAIANTRKYARQYFKCSIIRDWSKRNLPNGIITQQNALKCSF